MKPRRGNGAAAVFTVGVRAGTIASSSGRARVTPAPRRNVRRGSAFLVMIMRRSSVIRADRRARRLPPLKRHTLDDAEDEIRDPIVVRRGAPNDGTHGRRIVVLESASERIRHQPLD